MIVPHHLLKVVADQLSNGTFVLRNGKAAPIDYPDDPEGEVMLILSKTLCLNMAKDLMELHDILEQGMIPGQLTDDEKKALRWAIDQPFQSVAARHARTLAAALTRTLNPSGDGSRPR